MLHFDKLNTFYSQLKHNIRTKKIELILPNDTQILNLVKIFYKLGYIQTYKLVNDQMYIYLKIYKGNLLLQTITNISSPGRMVYCKNYKLNYYNQNYYNLIISSSKGFITLQEAILSNLGGFIIFRFK